MDDGHCKILSLYSASWTTCPSIGRSSPLDGTEMFLTTILLSTVVLPPPQDLQQTFPGNRGYGKLGRAVAAPGDMNRDGVTDYVFCAGGNSSGHGGGGGLVEAYVEARSGSDGALLWDDDGISGSDGFGTSMAGIADVNNDNRADVLIGASLADATGQVYLYNGRNGNVIWTGDGENPSDRYGYSVATLGDITGDGVEDFAVGAINWRDQNNTFVGRVYIYSGNNRALLQTLDGESSQGYFGSALAGPGDVDGDGTPDILIGSQGSVLNAQGKVYLYSGANYSLLWSQVGEMPYDRFGISVAGPGDVDGNGRPDLFVGASEHNADTGKVYLYAGETGLLIWSQEGEAVDDYFGTEVSAAGDMNRDQVPDLAVSAPIRSELESFQGKFYVYSGATGSLLFSRDGPHGLAQSGWHLAAGGDNDGDGYDELLVGVTGWDEPGLGIYTGRVEIWDGFQSFQVTSSALLPGQPATLTASNGLSDGELVYFGASFKGAGPYHPPGGRRRSTDATHLWSRIRARRFRQRFRDRASVSYFTARTSGLDTSCGQPDRRLGKE